MRLEITLHARERMQKYQVTEALLKKTLEKPDMVVGGYRNRKYIIGNLTAMS